MNIFKRTILWDVLYYVINTFTIFYIEPKGVMEGGEAFLFLIPLFIIGWSTEIWGKRFKGAKFYKYGIFDSLAKFISMVCAVRVYMQLSIGFGRLVCIVVYFVCMAASIIFLIMILRYEKRYLHLIRKKDIGLRNVNLSDKLNFK